MVAKKRSTQRPAGRDVANTPRDKARHDAAVGNERSPLAQANDNPPGVGIDLVSVRRLEQVIARWGSRFLDRIFTPGEIAFCESRHSKIQSYAARLAAKEALSKALGMGLGPGMRWRDIETVARASGRPVLVCRGTAGSLVAGRTVLLSLSHTDDHAAAVVLIF